MVVMAASMVLAVVLAEVVRVTLWGQEKARAMAIATARVRTEEAEAVKIGQVLMAKAVWSTIRCFLIAVREVLMVVGMLHHMLHGTRTGPGVVEEAFPIIIVIGGGCNLLIPGQIGMKAKHIERKVAIMDIEKVLQFGLQAMEMDPDESENFVKEFLQNIMEVNICVGT